MYKIDHAPWSWCVVFRMLYSFWLLLAHILIHFIEMIRHPRRSNMIFNWKRFSTFEWQRNWKWYWICNEIQKLKIEKLKRKYRTAYNLQITYKGVNWWHYEPFQQDKFHTNQCLNTFFYLLLLFANWKWKTATKFSFNIVTANIYIIIARVFGTI